MPVYSYRCRKCDEQFEASRRRFGGDKEVTCPGCGEKKPQRLQMRVYDKAPSGVGRLLFAP